jgi:hypothetical protein
MQTASGRPFGVLFRVLARLCAGAPGHFSGRGKRPDGYSVSFLVCKKNCRQIGLELIGELLGLLHDFGKYSFEYQCYIKSAVGLLCPGDSNSMASPLPFGLFYFTNRDDVLKFELRKKLSFSFPGQTCEQNKICT